MNCLMIAWNRHQAELHNWLRGRLPNQHDAEDLTQEVFIKALRQDGRFCALENPRAWLFRVARNALADRLRVQRETLELPDDLQDQQDEPDAVDTLSACLPRALTELSEEDRDALTCCDLEHMHQADYARLRGLTLAAAKSRVQRARKRLREHLTQVCQVRFDATGKVCCFVPRPPA